MISLGVRNRSRYISPGTLSATLCRSCTSKVGIGPGMHFRTFKSVSSLLFYQSTFAIPLRPLPRSSLLIAKQFGARSGLRPYMNYAEHYENMRRLRQNENFIWATIVTCAGVFMAWAYAWPRKTAEVVSTRNGLKRKNESQSPTLLKNLEKYCIFRVSDISNGNYLSWLGSAFSHVSTGHFLANMITLHAFGSIVAMVPGIRAGHLAQLTIGSALFGSAGFYIHESQRPQRMEKGAMGASGIVMGVGAAAFALVPRARLAFAMFIPTPLWILVPGYFLLDAYYLDDPTSRTAHSGHLGGAAFGLLFYALRLRGLGGIFGRRQW